MEKLILVAVFILAAVVMVIAMPYYVNDEAKKTRRYKSLKTEDIDSVPDEELETAVVDWLFAKLDTKGTTEVPIMRAMPSECRYVYATYIVSGEVISEGFGKCFEYIDSYFLSSAIEGFIALGAEQLAQVVEKACGVVGAYIAENGREKLNSLSENEALESLTLEFEGCDDILQLSDLMVKYIRENKYAFGD